ncbi:MAG: universal stress protein [Bacteroidia bacterium]
MTAFKIQKILIPIDFSETSLLAVKHGAFMAKLYKADICLLHVFEKQWSHFNVILPQVQIEDLSGFTNKIEAKLAEIAEGIRKEYAVKTTSICAPGNIFSEIVTIVNNEKIDVVVMGTHGVSGAEEFFMGSNTFKVVTKSPCPVLSVQTHAKKLGFSTILLPIDDSSHSRQKVMQAIELASHYNSKVHILGIVDSDVNLDKFKLKINQVENFLTKHNVNFIAETINNDNPATATLAYAKKICADLIMIMTDQEESLTGFLLGNYAQQIVNHSKIPVFSIRPIEGEYKFVDLTGDWRM